MKGYSFAISCIWFAISFLVAAFFLFADSAINRGPTERSAQFQAFEGYVLDNNVMASYQVTSDLECSAKCLRDKRCFSFNYKTALNKMPSECQLNNANRSTCPDCFKVKKDTTYYQDAEINNCTGSDGDWSNYDLYFPSKSIDSYASQTWSPNLSMFTLCFWMQTNDSDRGVTFSYAIQGVNNELTLFRNELAINNAETSYKLGNYYDGRRHHVCVTWENQAGSWKLNVNGKVINNGSSFQVRNVIHGGGVLVIGQDQDGLFEGPSGGGSFELKQSFMGSISGMNLWSRVLSDDEILRMSKICNFADGDVLKWSDFLVATHNVEVKCPSIFKI